MVEAQATEHVLMIRPVRFGPNSQTADSNRFQQTPAGSDLGIQARALSEFDALVDVLRAAGVNVVVFDDTVEPHTPDSIFPNNWVSFHADATATLYPMCATNRRMERRPDLLNALVLEHGFRIERTVDLVHHEQFGQYLEGTGSLVLDRANRVAYACISPRTHPIVLSEFATSLGYELVPFQAYDEGRVAIYHTNVMLSVGSGLAMVCAECVPVEQRSSLLRRLREGSRKVLELSYEQLHAFAGNVLELRSSTGASLLAMSDAARRSLRTEQLSLLEACDLQLISTAIPTIERIGGGSVRCMLAEIHLPRV
jgi:hypothetical protein